MGVVPTAGVLPPIQIEDPRESRWQAVTGPEDGIHRLDWQCRHCHAWRKPALRCCGCGAPR